MFMFETRERQLAGVPSIYILLGFLQARGHQSLMGQSKCPDPSRVHVPVPSLELWLISSLAPARRCNAGTGYYIAWGNVGSIIGSFIYRDSEAPIYPTGYGTAFSLAALGVLLACFVEWNYWKIKRKRDGLSKEKRYWKRIQRQTWIVWEIARRYYDTPIEKQYLTYI